jgi:ferredoxin
MNFGRRVLASIGFLIAGIVVMLFRDALEWDEAISMAISTALLMLGILGLGTAFGRRDSGDGLIRLDHFMPFARRKRLRPGKPSSIVTLAHRLLPSHLFFDPETGKEGSIRRWLRKIGPGTLSSPWRRLIQAFTFTLFTVLFFYVCWPYSAKPIEITQPIGSLQFKQIDQASGDLLFETSVPNNIDWATQDTWHLELPSSDASKLPSSLPVHVIPTQASNLRLVPIDPLPADQLDQILFSDGPLPVYDHPRPFWPSHHSDNLHRKERLPAEIFLIIDPLVSLSTAIASGNWVWSLAAAAIILILCLVIPRGFCGYVCPLGTLIDLFDRLIGQRVQRFRTPETGWWVHIKYYLLGAVLITSAFGVLTSGYVSAIPIITRGFLFIGEPLQTAMTRGVHLIPPMNSGHILSIILFIAVLGLGLLRARFWCKYVCPSGALFSLGNLFRATDRKVESSCIHCNKCVTICPFDAIKPDFTTRGTDCTQCQTCAGVCPTHSIKFVERWNDVALKEVNEPANHETAMGRRGFLSWAIGSSVAAIAATSYTSVNRITGANLDDPNSFKPVRPPGSVPEEDFLQQCIRCGECFKACPNSVLQPMGFAQGLEGLWTPEVKADWAGCESSCNACGQVCPTGAIRALPLEEKKVARMGLAIVNEQTCLPFAEREACQLCVDECNAAGYAAIEFTYVGTEADADGLPIPDTGYLAPVVMADKCVGCGLCQTRCHGINVEDKGLLEKSAIIIYAGKGREDRLISGSYRELRKAEEAIPIPEQQEDTFDPFSDAE